MNHQSLGKYGIYNLWRVKKSDLNKYAKSFLKNGVEANWRNKEFEKF